MTFKKKPPPLKIKHRVNAKYVGDNDDKFASMTRWQLEAAFIDAALLYERTSETLMDDFTWDMLGYHLANTWAKRSSFFRVCVNREMLQKKPSVLAIDWTQGIASAAIVFWNVGTP